MTPAELATDVRFRTQTDSTTFSNTAIMATANKYIAELSREAVKADEDILGMIATVNLVTTDTSREYSMPTGFMRMNRIEAKLDGTNWVKLKELNPAIYARTTDETTILANFSNLQDDAYFDFFRGSIWLYTGEVSSAVTDGMKMWYQVYASPITDMTSTTDMSAAPSTTTQGFPREFHELLSRYISRQYKSSGDRGLELAEDEREVLLRQDRMEAIYSLTGMNTNREVLGIVPEDPTYGYDL